ncbi:MAG: iron donor protein CyaY [Ectothiorhodospira sp.]
MTQPSFALQAEQTLEDLMERMGAVEALADLDMDIVDGVLTVEFDDGGKIILNRQGPVRQIWLASPEGPAHFHLDADRAQWVDERSGEELFTALGRILSGRLGQPIRL